MSRVATSSGQRGAAWLGVVLLGAGLLATVPAQAASDACTALGARYDREKTGDTALEISQILFAASDADCDGLVGRLLDDGASAEARDRLGNRPLARAARSGAGAVTALLIARGAQVDHRNLAGSTALYLAAEQDKPGTARLLLEHGADPNLPGTSGVTPLGAAAFAGDVALVEALLQHRADPNTRDGTGKAPVIYAAARGDAAIVKRLLDAGVDVEARYAHDLTVLMWGAGYVDSVAEANGVELVGLLLDRGAKVDSLDDRGETALMIAVQRGHVMVVDLLLKRGADPMRT